MFREQFPMTIVGEAIDADFGVLDALLADAGVPIELRYLCWDTPLAWRQEVPLVRIGFGRVGVILGRDG